MIEKLTTFKLPGSLEQRVNTPSHLSGGASSFNTYLNQEINTPASLEKIVLDFLMKTIESILSKTDQADPWASFSRIPFLGEGSFQPLPVSKNPIIETGPEASVSKQKGQEIDEIIQGAADQYGVEPSLIKAVISVESNGNPQAVSKAGAQGLMQLMPKTAAELGVTDPFDPKQNIIAGTRYLSRLLDRYEGNHKLALAAYNWGMGNLEKNPQAMPKETRDYLVRVEKKFQFFREDSSSA
jgi:soluble lytic murein transglycosylase-like protein